MNLEHYSNFQIQHFPKTLQSTKYQSIKLGAKMYKKASKTCKNQHKIQVVK